MTAGSRRRAAFWGAGLGYRYVDYDLDVDKDTYVASFDYQFNGPSIFIEAGF